MAQIEQILKEKLLARLSLWHKVVVKHSPPTKVLQCFRITIDDDYQYTLTDEMLQYAGIEKSMDVIAAIYLDDVKGE